MNELNEKLAVEVMGWSRFECDDPRDRPLGDYYSDTQDGKQTLCWHWNPTTDLNQLKMCYEAAENGSEDAEKFESMVYWHVSEDLRLINKCFLKDITTAIFKHPELVAQAILKAKGVS